MEKRIFKLLIIFFIIFFLGLFFIALKKSSIYDTKDLVGNRLENINLDHFYEDKLITEKDIKNSDFILINFWASWCAPCRIEHPFLLELNGEKKLKILGVNFKDKNENATKFLNELGNPYDLLTKDEFGKNSINFGIYGIPESILVNSELVIIKKFIGPISAEDFKYIKMILNK